MFRVQRILTLLKLCWHMPRQVKNWPFVLYHDIRMRMGKPAKPRGSEIRLRNGMTFGLYAGSSGLVSVFSDVYLLSCYDKRRPFRIRASDTVVDIGANVGFFALKAGRLASSGRVFAFEPCPPHYEMLESNLSRNGLHNVVLSPEAIWGSETSLEIRYSLGEGALHEPMHTSVYDIGGDRVVSVPAISLAALFAREKIDRCHFLKLDCEGAEYEILYAAGDAVLSVIDRIAMEWHRFSPEHDPEKLALHLREHGFEVQSKTFWHGKTGYLFAERRGA